MIEIWNLTAENLASTLADALSNKEAARRASIWSQLISEEPGVGLAADLIEDHAERLGVTQLQTH